MYRQSRILKTSCPLERPPSVFCQESGVNWLNLQGFEAGLSAEGGTSDLESGRSRSSATPSSL